MAARGHRSRGNRPRARRSGTALDRHIDQALDATPPYTFAPLAQYARLYQKQFEQQFTTLLDDHPEAFVDDRVHEARYLGPGRDLDSFLSTIAELSDRLDTPEGQGARLFLEALPSLVEPTRAERVLSAARSDTHGKDTARPRPPLRRGL